MRKHNSTKKVKFSKRSGGKRSSGKRSSGKRSSGKRSGGKRSGGKRYTKRNFAKRTVKKFYRGGDEAKYPQVYGIENRSVLYPISKYGIPAGPFDPPALSNGPNGNGPYPGELYGAYGGKRSRGKRSRSKRSSGKRKVRRSKYHVGGGSQFTIIPQPIVNATRSLTGGLTEIANGFGGYTNSASLNPMPYNQPALEANVKYIRTDFPNVALDYNNADSYVSTL
jgi:hypothetical protein